jgi:hypothetical protein
MQQQQPNPGDDFPLLCDACLGDNKYVRMTKNPNGVECKISKKPTTLFRWSIGGGVYRQTCVDFQVASAKNICQCCMCDLTFGLPVSVRDAFLKAQKERGETMGGFADSLPKSQVGKDFQLALLSNQAKDEIAESRSRGLHALVDGANHHAIAATDLGYVPRLPNLCSKWLDGGCPKGKKCELRPCCGAIAFPELEDEDARKELEDEVKAVSPERFNCTVWNQRTIKNLKHAAKRKRSSKTAVSMTMEDGAAGGATTTSGSNNTSTLQAGNNNIATSGPVVKRMHVDSGKSSSLSSSSSMPSSSVNDGPVPATTNVAASAPSTTTSTLNNTSNSNSSNGTSGSIAMGPTTFIGFGTPGINTTVPLDILQAFKKAKESRTKQSGVKNNKQQ